MSVYHAHSLEVEVDCRLTCVRKYIWYLHILYQTYRVSYAQHISESSSHSCWVCNYARDCTYHHKDNPHVDNGHCKDEVLSLGILLVYHRLAISRRADQTGYAVYHHRQRALAEALAVAKRPGLERVPLRPRYWHHLLHPRWQLSDSWMSSKSKKIDCD